MGPDGDLIVTSAGELGAVAGVFNCAQAVFLRFKTTPGEVPLHPDFGSNIAGSLVGSKLNVGAVATQANQDLQQIIAEDPRFTAAQVVITQQPASVNYPDSVALGIQATLVGGQQLTLLDVTDPAPSDVTDVQLVAPSIDPTLTYDPTTVQQFFADQSEFDTLNDLNTLQAIVNDTPGDSILGTGG